MRCLVAVTKHLTCVLEVEVGAVADAMPEAQAQASGAAFDPPDGWASCEIDTVLVDSPRAVVSVVHLGDRQPSRAEGTMVDHG